MTARVTIPQSLDNQSSTLEETVSQIHTEWCQAVFTNAFHAKLEAGKHHMPVQTYIVHNILDAHTTGYIHTIAYLATPHNQSMHVTTCHMHHVQLMLNILVTVPNACNSEIPSMYLRHTMASVKQYIHYVHGGMQESPSMQLFWLRLTKLCCINMELHHVGHHSREGHVKLFFRSAAAACKFSTAGYITLRCTLRCTMAMCRYLDSSTCACMYILPVCNTSSSIIRQPMF